jgi:hypothetical protein
MGNPALKYVRTRPKYQEVDYFGKDGHETADQFPAALKLKTLKLKSLPL